MSSLSLGLATTAIGLLVVFFGLAVLICCILVMTSITDHKKKAPAPESAPVPAPVAVEEAPAEEDNGEPIAAITAAIAAVWQDEDTGFVVRRVRRCQNSPAWQRAAREEQMYSHM